MREGAERLHAARLPPSFVFLADETWHLQRECQERLQRPSIGDVLAWRIGPGSAGFSPHRDRQMENVADSFRADGQPKYVTCWMALSHVNEPQSSLFVIPADIDPGYKDSSVDLGDPLQAALKDRDHYQCIRNFTGPPGSAWYFSHRVLHWGSAQRSETEPRVSISFVCADSDFEECYVAREKDVHTLSLTERIALVSAQMICYYQRFQFDESQLIWFWAEVDSHKALFSESYLEKTRGELIAALQEFSSLSDEAEELMLDLQLDSEFQMDDYDEMERMEATPAKRAKMEKD